MFASDVRTWLKLMPRVRLFIVEVTNNRRIGLGGDAGGSSGLRRLQLSGDREGPLTEDVVTKIVEAGEGTANATGKSGFHRAGRWTCARGAITAFVARAAPRR